MSSRELEQIIKEYDDEANSPKNVALTRHLAPTRQYVANPDDPEGAPLEGPGRDDLRPVLVVRTEDHRLPTEGINVGNSAVSFLVLPPPPVFEAHRVELGS